MPEKSSKDKLKSLLVRLVKAVPKDSIVGKFAKAMTVAAGVWYVNRKINKAQRKTEETKSGNDPKRQHVSTDTHTAQEMVDFIREIHQDDPEKQYKSLNSVGRVYLNRISDDKLQGFKKENHANLTTVYATMEELHKKNGLQEDLHSQYDPTKPGPSTLSQ